MTAPARFDHDAFERSTDYADMSPEDDYDEVFFDWREAALTDERAYWDDIKRTEREEGA